MKREQLLVSKKAKTLKGHPRPPGAGRKPGTLNKTTAEMRDVFVAVFDGLGGTKAMLQWAKSSPHRLDLFYVKILPKLLPSNPIESGSTLTLEKIERVIIHHDSEKARAEEKLITGQYVEHE